MRLPPRSWTSFYTRLGFRRLPIKRRRAQPRYHAMHGENLEHRHLLATVDVASYGDIYESTATSFTISRDGSTSSDLAVNYSLSGGAYNGSDYEYLSGYVVIPAGQSSVNLPLTTINDDEFEGTESVVITIESGGYTIGNGSTTINILDDETGLPKVYLYGNDTSATEGSDTAQYYLWRYDTSNELTVNLYVSGSASLGSDYTVSEGGGYSLTFAPGQNYIYVTLDALTDGISEGDETAHIELMSGSGYEVSAYEISRVATITISDGSAPPTPTVYLYENDSSATEGSDNGQFYLYRSDDTSQPLTVYFSIGGSASNGSDYYLSDGSYGSITFPAWQSTVYVDLYAYTDGSTEGTETARFELYSSSGYNVSEFEYGRVATINIADPVLPTVYLYDYDSSATEGNDNGQYYLYRTEDLSQSLTVYFSIGGSASNGSDYYLSDGNYGSITFPAWQSSIYIDLYAYTDGSMEGTETATLELYASSGYNVSGDLYGRAATVSIQDNSVPSVWISASSYVYESTATTFTIGRNGDTTNALTVNYSLDGSAYNGSDYEYLPGSVTIPAGASSVEVTLTTINDDDYESTESININLSSSSEYNIDNGYASIALYDDETGLPKVYLYGNDTSATEGSDNGEFYLWRYDTSNELTVYFNVSGSASQGTDYTLGQGSGYSVTFQPGEGTIYVPLVALADAVAEGDETARIELYGSSGYEVSAFEISRVATITISDGAGNQAPTTMGMPNLTRSEDAAAYDIELRNYFGDFEDGSAALVYTVTNNTQPGIVGTSINASTDRLTLNFLANQFGTANITIRATDTAGAWTETTFQVTVESVNDTPVLHTPLGTVNVNEDAAPTSLALTSHFSDIETTAAQLTYSVISNSNTAVASAAINPTTGALTLTWQTNASGTGTVRVRAADPQGAYAEADINFNVAPVNDPPTLATPLPDVTVSAGTTTSQVNLAGYFADVDDLPANRTYFAQSSNTAIVVASVNPQTGVLTLTWQTGAVGAATITAGVTDSAAQSASDTFQATLLAPATPLISISASPPSGILEGSSSTIQLTRTGDTSQPLTVFYQWSGSATNGSDYGHNFQPLATQVTFAAGATTATIPIQAFSDMWIEGNESVQLTLLDHANYDLNPQGTTTAAITIIDNANPLPEVALYGQDIQASEDGNSVGSIYLWRPASNVNTTLTVNLSIGGTATLGTDYQLTNVSNGTLTFQPGELYAYISVVPLGDGLNDPGETVRIEVLPTSEYGVSPYEISRVATVTISETAAVRPFISLSASQPQVEEGGSVNLVATLDAPQTQEVYVNLRVDGTGRNDGTISPYYAVIPIGQTQATFTFTANANVDGNRILRVALNGSSLYELTPGEYITSVTILDDVPNQPPTASGIPDVFAQQDGASQTVALRDYFADAEDSDTQLTFQVLETSAGSLVNATVNPATGILTLAFVLGQSGSRTVTIRAIDTEGAYVDDSFTVSVNAPPVIAALGPFNYNEDSVPQTIALWPLVSDTENGVAELALSVVGNTAPGLVTTSISPSTGQLTLSLPANAHGSATLTLRVADTSGGVTTREFTVNIANVNDAPTLVQPFTPVVVSQNAAPSTLQTAAHFADIDSTLSYSAISSNPAVVVASINASTGELQLQWQAGAQGSAEITVTATDPSSASISASFAATIIQGAHLPTAVADQYSLRHDTTLTTNAAQGVLANDFDIDGETLSAVLVNTVAHGTLTLGSNGSFVYTPNAGFVGADQFTYRASDGNGQSAVVVVALNVTNSAPIASPDTYQAWHDATLTISAANGVLTNDHTEPGEALAAQLVASPQHGTLTLNANGSFTYIPAAGYVGSDQFSYRISDGLALSNIAFVDISVGDNPPVARGENYFVLHDKQLTKSAAEGLLANESADPGETLTTQLATGPAHGTLSLSPTGAFTYTPAAGYVGLDSFTYRVHDGRGLSDPVEVSINVTNRRPTSREDHYFVSANGSLATTVAQGILANDSDDVGDSATITVVESTSQGALVVNADGSFTYTPATGFAGSDRFIYRVSDGLLQGDETEVVLEVTAAQVATRGNSYSITHDRTFTANATEGVLANDWQAQGLPLNAQLVTAPAHGSLTLNADGSFTYVPAAGYTGPDGFTYLAVDSNGISAEGTVSLTVVNHAVLSNEDDYRVVIDGTLTKAAPQGVLSNDYDEDGDTLTATLISGPAHGELTFLADGSFVYLPDIGYLGNDQFSYRATDGLSPGEITAVTIVVFNNKPEAVTDRYTLHHGTTLTVSTAAGVLGNDRDDAEQELVAQLTGNPSHGALNFQPDGSFIYTPNTTFSGEDTFYYRLFDGYLYSDPVAVKLKVTNRAPTAMPDQFQVVHDRTLNIAASSGVLRNDRDLDGDALATQVVSGPTNGTLTMQPDGSFVYVPHNGYVGPDGFSYRVSDGAAQSDDVFVTIEVSNIAPAASHDSYDLTHDRPLNVPAASGLLRNDADADADSLTIQITDAPDHGQIVVNPDGSFTYTPQAGYVGGDYFNYRLNDGAANSNVARVSLAVNNQRPALQERSYRLPHGQTFTADAANGLLAQAFDADNDTLQINILSQPAHGDLSVSTNGAFQYTPDSNYTGPDEFTYRVFDGVAYSSAVRVRLTIENTAPVANSDYYQTRHGQAVNANAASGILANDWDSDNDSLTITLIAQPGNGSLELNNDGSFVYTPNSNFVGEDTFRYRISDGAANSAIQTVTIRVTNFNPIVADDAYTVKHDATLTVAAAAGVLSNDSDGDEETLTAAVAQNPSHGTLSLQSDGSFIYTPAASFAGEDEFTYTATDGIVSRTGTVRISVRNSAPVATDDAYSVLHDRTLNATAGQGVLANDWDWDEEPVTITVLTQPSHGTLSMTANGSFSFVPAAGYVGKDSFTYRLSDGISESRVATIKLDITNSAPTAIAGNYAVQHDQTLTQGLGGGLRSLVSDLDNDTLVFQTGTTPAHGTLSLAADGSFTYTPSAGYVGADSFTFTVTDSASAPVSGVVTIAVKNRTAIGAGDTYYVATDGTLTVTAADGLLKNDELEAGETNTVSLESSPAHGTLTLSSNGSFVYTPTASYFGSDTFTYRVHDGVSQSAPVTVTIQVGGSSGALPDAYIARRNAVLNVSAAQGLLTNDIGSNLQAVLVASPAHGTATLAADGSFVYTPAAGYVGSDAFTYKVLVDGVEANTVTVSLDVVNDLPQASADRYRIQHDKTLAGGSVLGNDSDPNGDTLTAQLVSGPAHGTLTLQANGTFTYTPAAEYVGPDSFQYQANDGQGNSAVVTVEIDVWNNAPVSYTDLYRVAHDRTLVIGTGESVLLNDTRDDGETLTAVLASAPAHGAVALAADGSFVYTPNAGYVGVDAFTYRADDGLTLGNVTTVYIDVWNVAPRGTANIYHVHHDETLTIGQALGVVTNDVDTPGELLIATLWSAPANAANFALLPNGAFTYTPVANFVGVDGFSYVLSDGAFTTAPIWVSIDVWNTTPGIRNNAYQMQWDETLDKSGVLGVLGNDWDNDGDPLTAQLVNNATNGNLNFNADGSFTYTPNVGFVGVDSFTYRITDGPFISQPATVTIDVQNARPVTASNSYRVHHSDTLSISATQGFAGDDYDPDGDDLTVVNVTNPSHGSLSWNEDGSFEYTPNEGYVGSDSFTYQLDDGVQQSDVTTVHIDVWNNIPWAHRNYFAVRRGAELSDNVLTDDTEWDGDTMEAEVVSGPQHGTLSLSSDGSFTYTPNSDYSGADYFTYRVFDGAQYTEAITVDIDVQNNAPRGVSDTIVKHHKAAYASSSITGNVLSNDWEPDGESMTVEAVGTLPQGLTLNNDGTFTYTLPTGSEHWTGTVSFSYKISDGADESTPVQVKIEVYDSAPIALEDLYRVKHDTPLTSPTSVLANDFDSDDAAGDLKAILVNEPSQDHGTLDFNEDGTFTFTPKAKYAGEASFQYKVFDGAKYSGIMSVSIMVMNQDPTAIVDFYYGVYGLQISSNGTGVLQNDRDMDEDALKAIIVDQPKYGTVILQEDGSFVYIASPTYVIQSFGFDSFTYKASDGIGESAPTMVVLTIQKAPQAAYPDTYRVLKNSSNSYSIPAGVLANDWVGGNGELKAYIKDQPYNGQVQMAQDGSFTFTPNEPGFSGDVTFTYKIASSPQQDEIATVKLKIVNQEAVDDQFYVDHDRTLQGDVLGNDIGTPGEPKRAVLDGNVSNGTLDLTPDGRFVYTPPAGFTGSATFKYKVTNGRETTATSATVTIQVTNDAPTAAADSYSTTPQTPIVRDFHGGVLSNDSDGDSDVLTAELVSGVSSSAGTLTFNEDGSFTFIPADTFKGQTSFTYRAKDGATQTAPQTVNITVNDNVPQATNHNYDIYHNETLSVGPGKGVLKNATDEVRHQLVAEIVSNPTHATSFSLNTADGSFVYTPEHEYVGQDSFTYRVKDKAGNYSETRTVHINVTNVLAVGPWKSIPLDHFSGTGYGGTIYGDVLDVDTDADGDPITAVLVQGLNGLNFNDNGSFSYVGYGGSFTFAITDGHVTSGEYTVYLGFGYGGGGTPSQDRELEPGTSFYSGAGMSVYNWGPGTIYVGGSGDTASLSAVSGDSFSVTVYNGHASWSGAAPGGLSLGVWGNVSAISTSGNVSVSAGKNIASINTSGNVNASAGGNIASVTASGDVQASAGGDIGNLSGRNVSASGDNIGNINATQDASANAYGGWTSSGRWVAASGIGVIGNITAGRDVTNVHGAQIGTITAARHVNWVNGYNIDNPIRANGGDIGDIFAIRNISAEIYASGHIGDGNYYYDDDAIEAGHSITGNITAGTYIESVEAGWNITSTISAGTYIGYVEAGKSISGTIDAGGAIDSIFAADHITNAATITAGGAIGSITADWDILGTITANGVQSYGGGASIGTIRAGRDLGGSATAANGISYAEAGRNLSASLVASDGDIGSVTAWAITSSAVIQASGGDIGTVTAKRNIDGTINADGNLQSVTAGRDLEATVTAGDNITTISAGLNINGDITATDGNISTVSAGETIDGDIKAGGNINSVSAGRNISGDITADDAISQITAGLAISGAIEATDGNIGSVYAGTDISGDITSGANISVVAAGRHLTGDVDADGNITTVLSGRHWHYGSWGIYTYNTGGDIYESTIRAGGHIGTVEATRYNGFGGTIGSATITADTAYISQVSAGSNIDATITAKTYIGSVQTSYSHFGDIAGSIKATDEYVGTVNANFGKINATIEAGTYINSVKATHAITGNIKAGTRIGTPGYENTGVESVAGDITGNIEAGTDISRVSAGKHIKGTVKAGRDITVVHAGVLGGGNIEKDITAGRTLGEIIAQGPWSKDDRPEVYTASAIPHRAIDFAPGSDKFQHQVRPRPAKPSYFPLGDYGNIKGKITAKSIGNVTAFGTIDRDIKTTETLGNVWALGDIGGKIDVGMGGATVQTWGKGGAIKTHTTGSNISLRAYEKITGTLDSAGAIEVYGWDSIQGDLKARNDIRAWMYKDITGNIESTDGKAIVTTHGALTGDVVAKEEVSVGAFKIFADKIKSLGKGVAAWASDQMFVSAVLPMMAKIWMISLGNIKGTYWNAFSTLANNIPTVGGATTNVVAFGDIDVAEIISTDVKIAGRQNVTVGLKSWGEVEVEGRNVDLKVEARYWPVASESLPQWAQQMWGDGYVDKVKVQALGNLKVDLDIGGHADLLSTGNVTGTINTGAHNQRSDTERSNFRTNQQDSWVAVAARGDMKATIKAHSAITVESWGKVSGDIYGGAAIDVMGNKGVEGTITAEGYLRAQSWQDYKATTTSKNGFANLFAAGSFNATVEAKGDVQIESWGEVSGKITAGKDYSSDGESPTAAITAKGNVSAEITSSHDVMVTSFATLSSPTIKGVAGNVQIEAYQDISGTKVTAGRDASAVSWNTVSNLELTAGSEGTASLWSQADITQATVKGGTASAASAGNIKVTVTATKGEASVESLKAVQSGTVVTAERGGVYIFAGETVNATATALSQYSSQSTQSIEVLALKKIEGSYTARDGVEITGLDEVNVTAESKEGAIDVFAKGKLNGTYTAKTNIDAISLATGGTDAAIQGTYKTTSGNINALTLGKFQATVTAGDAADIYAAADVAGTITAGGAASVTAEKAVSATVTGGGKVVVAAIDGDVSGAVKSNQGEVEVVASKQVTGSVHGYTNATVSALGNVSGTVTADQGNSTVMTMAALSGNVSAGQAANVFAKGAVSSTVNSGTVATVTSFAAISGNITAGTDANVLSMASISGTVEAGQHAAVSAVFAVSGDVTATSGNASVVAGTTASGTTTAGTDATLFAVGNFTGTVDAGQDARVTTLGNHTGTVTADRDATVWVKGTTNGGEITAGRNLHATLWGNVSTPLTATSGNADVTIYANLDSTVQAGTNVTAWVLGTLTGNITADEGSADVTAVGDITNTTSAGQNLRLSTFGELQATVDAGGSATLDAFGGTIEVTATAGDNVNIRGVDTVDATVNAGGSATIISLGNATLDVVAQQGVHTTVKGSLDGTLSAPAGSVQAFATEQIQVDANAGQDVSLASLQAITGTNITAGGHANLHAIGQIDSVEATVGSLMAWSYAGVTGNEFTSTAGNVSILSNSSITGTTINSARDVSAAALGGQLEAEVVAGNAVRLFGFGLTADVQSGGAAQVVSYGNLQLQAAVGGTLTAMATGVLSATGLANNVTLISYGTINSNITATNSLSAWSLGSIAGTLQSMNHIDVIETWGSLTATIHAANSIRDVHVWGTILGSITAGNVINQVFAGDAILANIAAPAIGWVVVGDRSPFVDLPGMPVAAVRELVAATVDAYTEVLAWNRTLERAEVEINAAATAAQVDVLARLAQSLIALTDATQEAQARIQDIAKQGQVALHEAQTKIDRALEMARVDAQAARLELQEAISVAEAAAARAMSELKGEAAARLKAAQDQQTFFNEASDLAKVHQGNRADSAEQQFFALLGTYSQAFVGTFLGKVVEYGLDIVQEVLEWVGTFGELLDFIVPGLGSLVAAAADLTNAAIYAARGQYINAVASAAGAIPYAGTFFKAGIKLGGKQVAEEAAQTVGKKIMKHISEFADDVAAAGAKGLSKFVRELPALTLDAAKRVKCVVTGTGCFVAGTLVVVDELPAEATTLADTGEVPDNAATSGAASLLLVGIVGAVLLERRRRRKEDLDQQAELDALFGEDDELDDLFDNLDDIILHKQADQEAALALSLQELEQEASDVDAYATVHQSRWIPGLVSECQGHEQPALRRHGGHGTRRRGFASRILPFTWLAIFGILSATYGWLGGNNIGDNQSLHLSSVSSRIQSDHRQRASRLAYRTIDAVRVGEWVVADNPEVTTSAGSGDFDAIDADVSRKLSLRLTKQDGSMLFLELIRHEFWLEHLDAKVGSTIDLALPELGAEGVATVLAIEPCPIPEKRPSSRHYLVTGTFAHSSSATMDIAVEGMEDPISCTSNHPFWCVERQSFVPAGGLTVGQHLMSVTGQSQKVAGLSNREKTEEVFNLEVDHQHVYFVSSVGLLAHNTYTTPAMREAANTAGRGGWKYYRDPFTNLWKATREKLSPDHIFPAKYIEEMARKAGLTAKQIKELLQDPRNLTPLTESLNKSKSDRLANEITEMLGEKVSKEWKDWLRRRQNSLQEYFEQRVKDMAAGKG